jgi:hypothetical protein
MKRKLEIPILVAVFYVCLVLMAITGKAHASGAAAKGIHRAVDAER